MGYFKPNSKKAIKIAMFIKGLCGTIAAAAYYEVGSKGALIVMIVGFCANELINVLSDGTDEMKRRIEQEKGENENIQN